MPKRTCSPNPGNLLTYLRTYHQLTLTDLAKRCGVNLNLLCQYSLRGTSMGIGNLKRLADFFHIPVDALARNDCTVLASLPALSPQRTDVFRRRLRKTRRKMEQIGDMGEDFVAKLEREKLKGTVYEGMVNTAVADDPHAGCDMLSMDLSLDKLLPVEVKSTIGPEDEPVYFSAEEFEFLKRCAEEGAPYELHRVFYVFDPGKTARTVYTAAEALETFTFEPDHYVCYRKKK